MTHCQQLIFCADPYDELSKLVSSADPDKVFVLVDSNTRKVFEASFGTDTYHIIEISAGDRNKNIESLTHVWAELVNNGATRRSVLINFGGGMITDLGGFAASTFKRGIKFINIPTTILACVDASVGGKTGINFLDFKNEVGVFSEAIAVIISTTPLVSLSTHERLSGYAEMLKHGLIAGGTVYHNVLNFEPTNMTDSDQLLKLLEESVKVKSDIVLQDPTEKGLRKALNLGHTGAHAFENLMFRRGCDLSHGYAVAWGLVLDAILSRLKYDFPTDEMQRLVGFVREYYGAPDISCEDYDNLIEAMRHDKKNPSHGQIIFTLMRAPGNIVLDAVVSSQDITAALDILRDSL